ncbi:MAG TPA: DUF3078 domain-containing protein [Flavobacterium sp.]|uniref:DUF3078 domain-containing protein n=1 Tax=Flavobacterium sp. TaxID=239 RepID=UPI001B781C46|nr:DUF3078 domain-containing protein [Flavobacterium sp.]MBP7182837.1 DUF3078 domain-containing protein [Flavobacterium sp.]MBP7316826.1 DUF3078 domain-containing protein [Flavobacterium sp.]HRL72519.1 DUF3078 domain-containing protein [Flavobacterium sp.]HRM11511.1 DUF3078 domain-containing protein [Flavobacterium sp.]
MKKMTFSLVFFFALISMHAQETATDTTKFWTKKGNISLLFNQSAYNKQWLGGGTSNVAGNFGLNYDFNYKKDDIVWDNKFILAYGLTKIKGGDKPAKTDDRLELNSLWGKKAKGQWYYSMFFNFKTQMDTGLDKNDEKISHFFSPAYFQLGPGMLWKKSNNLSVNFSPATSKLIIVHPHFTKFRSSFGVLQGDSSRFEFGSSISGYYKFNIMTNVSVENRLNLYSNYLDNPQNVDVDYQMNVIMKINKYLSANVAVQAIYDDNSVQAVQVRELFGLGVNYGF